MGDRQYLYLDRYRSGFRLGFGFGAGTGTGTWLATAGSCFQR